MLFGEPIIPIEELAGRLRVMVPELASHQPHPEGNEAYTFGVKNSLLHIGKEKGVRTFFTGAEPGMKEFMLDVVWWRKTEGGEEAVLGAESEWGNPRTRTSEGRVGEVIEDFEKLLSFKAPMKLLFFCADNPPMRFAIHSAVTQYLRNFAQHVEGEQYLFMEYALNDCFSYVWRADRDRRCPTAELRPLDQKSAEALRFARAATV